MNRATSITILLVLVLLLGLMIWSVIPEADEELIVSELPEIKPEDLIFVRQGFTISFDTITKQAVWVAWELTRDELNGESERSDRFKADPMLEKFTNLSASYSRSGYDRGHLAPAADMTWSDSAMLQSFYYSNISPQNPALNRGLWRKSEEMARDLAEKHSNLYVITGPIFQSSDTTFLAGGLPVPHLFYKVFLVNSPYGIQGLGMIMPNAPPGNDLFRYTVTIDSVESLTGINFFPTLTKKQEKKAESVLHTLFWR